MDNKVWLYVVLVVAIVVVTLLIIYAPVWPPFQGDEGTISSLGAFRSVAALLRR